jgi:hypothetical protein
VPSYLADSQNHAYGVAIDRDRVMSKVIEQFNNGTLIGNTYGGYVVGQIMANNGYVVTINRDNGQLWDNQGRYGYTAHFTGAYVCYTCGHMCECGDD